MPVLSPTWTDERIELLKQHFEAGLSCREIAADIGVSRNAVIGKLSRLNLTSETSGVARRSPRKNGAKADRPRTSARLRHQMLPALDAELQPAADEEPIPNEHACSLFEL